MRKRDCITTLNELLSYILEHDCFHHIKEELGIEDEEFEIVLNSTIIDIENDDTK